MANRGAFLPLDRRPSGTDAQSGYALSPGRAYVVAGVVALADHLSLLVRDDDGLPAFVPAELFAGSVDVPADWRFGLVARGSGSAVWGEARVAAWGYAALVDDPGHVDALLGGDPSARAVFDERVAEPPGR
ncbi:hypothetical protein [Cellulomonas sp. Marseille-Q8402]